MNTRAHITHMRICASVLLVLSHPRAAVLVPDPATAQHALVITIATRVHVVPMTHEHECHDSRDTTDYTYRRVLTPRGIVAVGSRTHGFAAAMRKRIAQRYTTLFVNKVGSFRISDTDFAFGLSTHDGRRRGGPAPGSTSSPNLHTVLWKVVS